MKVVESHLDLEHELYIRASAHREPGLHVSGVTYPILIRDYAQYFKNYADDDEEKTIRDKRILEKGHVVEEAWGDALGTLVDRFDKPEPRFVDEDGQAYTKAEFEKLENPPFGLWMSPDGYIPYLNGDKCDWPDDWPELVTPCILECKGSGKSCGQPKGHNGVYITHPKFFGWHWNVMAYCKGWGVTDAYYYIYHFMGDYKGHPPEPKAMVHHLQWTQAELDEHWNMLIEEAKCISV